MKAKRIVVAGSINMDLIIHVALRPGLGETVFGERISYIPGGKGLNQAIAARRLGQGPVALAGKLGNDPFGDSLWGFLQSQGLELQGVTRASAPTGTAVITIDSAAENAIIVVPGANFQLRPEDIDAMEGSIEGAGAVVTQLEIPIPTVHRLFQLAEREGAITFLNAAPARPLPSKLLELVDYLCVNETELGQMAGLAQVPDEVGSIIAAARSLAQRGPKNLVVTLGPRGSVTLADGEVIVVEGLKVKAVDPTGAGDCFVGAMAAQLAAGADIRKALEFANRAAALSVQRPGASSSIPHRWEVEAPGPA